MENEKQIGSSSSSSSYSSFTTDLFGAQESSSTGSFASIFPPPSTVARRNSTNSEFRVPMQKQPSGSQVWSANQGTPENLAKDSEGASHSVNNKERRSIFQEREDSCPLGSSLYYGGQEDMYVQSSSAQTSESYPNFKKDGGEDDPNENNLHSASRGNWWQGSLYY